jgi:quinolinate synthase
MIDTLEQIDYKKEIQRLKKEKNAIILAHYYQEADIQDVADYLGDSLGLSQKAAQTEADIIVFAGVHFMAETAKILNPTKKVLLPDMDAGCSLADSCPAVDLAAFKAQHPEAMVISYINCSSEVKALTDIICTSANAKKIVESVSKDQQIIFAPDRNLGRYLNQITGRDMLLWDGACIVHEAFSMEKLGALQKKYPNAQLIAHPEAQKPLLDLADFIGSTTALLNYVKNDAHPEYIVATEAGILHQMKKVAPEKNIIPAPANENNTCACSECPYMKMNTMEKLYRCMQDETPEIIMDEEIRLKALKPIQRMLELS